MRAGRSPASAARERARQLRRISCCTRCAIGVNRRRAFLLRCLALLLIVLPIAMYISLRTDALRDRALRVWTIITESPSPPARLRSTPPSHESEPTADAATDSEQPDTEHYDSFVDRVRAAASVSGVHLLSPGGCLRTAGSLHAAGSKGVPSGSGSDGVFSGRDAAAGVWLLADSRGGVCTLEAVGDDDCCHFPAEEAGAALTRKAGRLAGLCDADERCCESHEACVSSCVAPTEAASRARLLSLTRAAARVASSSGSGSRDSGAIVAAPALKPLVPAVATRSGGGGSTSASGCLGAGSLRGLALPGREGPPPAFESGWLSPGLDALDVEAHALVQATPSERKEGGSGSASVEELAVAAQLLEARAFSLCGVACRTRSLSTWYENRYARTAHHCWGVAQPLRDAAGGTP